MTDSMSEHQCHKPEGSPDVLCVPGVFFECPECHQRWVAEPWGDDEVCWRAFGEPVLGVESSKGR